VISTFDVVHDSADPAGLLQAIRGALKDDGRFVCLDMNASHKPEENVGPLHTLLYGCSVHYCMSVSLGAGGSGSARADSTPQWPTRCARRPGSPLWRRQAGRSLASSTALSCNTRWRSAGDKGFVSGR
jgi:hypothetical protein